MVFPRKHIPPSKHSILDRLPTRKATPLPGPSQTRERGCSSRLSVVRLFFLPYDFLSRSSRQRSIPPNEGRSKKCERRTLLFGLFYTNQAGLSSELFLVSPLHLPRVATAPPPPFSKSELKGIKKVLRTRSHRDTSTLCFHTQQCTS